MVKAMRLQEKAKQVGFEWETKEQVWEKIEEEKLELLHAVQSVIKRTLKRNLETFCFL